MAEICPFCGSKDLSTSIIGMAEKAVELSGTILLCCASEITSVFKLALTGKPSSKTGKLLGPNLDDLCSTLANNITKKIPTGRICNNCGRTFHSTPDEGWYDKFQ